MADLTLSEARAARDDVLLNDFIDRRLDVLLSADTVSPDARVKLRSLLAHYAKEPHPFRSCVKDNMERFGPGRTEKVCATLKDLIRGTTRWRHGADTAMSDSNIDEETEALLLSLNDKDIEELVAEAMTHA